MNDSTDDYLVRVVNVSRKFGSRWALRDVSLGVTPGKIHVILGHNGAGKSTLFRLLQQQLSPTEGTIDISPKLLDSRGRKRLGTVAEANGLYPRFSVWENIELAARIFNVPKQTWQPLAEELLAKVSLDTRKNDPVINLSAGMKRKLSVIRAFIHYPNLLILDEPTAGLDAASKYAIRVLIQSQMTPERTVLIATQDLWESERMATRLTILRQGRVLYDGGYSDLSQKVNLRKFRLSQSVDLRSWTAVLPPSVTIIHTETDSLGATLTLRAINWPEFPERAGVAELPLHLEEIYLELDQQKVGGDEN